MDNKHELLVLDNSPNGVKPSVICFSSPTGAFTGSVTIITDKSPANHPGDCSSVQVYLLHYHPKWNCAEQQAAFIPWLIRMEN